MVEAGFEHNLAVELIFKTSKMKTTKLFMILAICFSMMAFGANAQTNPFKNAKDKVGKVTGGKKDKDKDIDKDNAPNDDQVNDQDENASDKKVKSDFDAGNGYFYTSFKPASYQEKVNVGDELYVRMELGKTMIELAQEGGLDVSHFAYAYVDVYIDGKKTCHAGPYTFPSNYSKVWTYINIPLSISPDFIEKIQADQSLLETNQDVWVFQEIFVEGGIVSQYTTAAIQNMSVGTHTVKVDFGLCESDDDEEAKMVACSGEVQVLVDQAGAEKLAENGPKYLRPLKEEERGTLTYSSSTFTPGNGELTANLSLPQSPKYYNMKWCQASSCDYDHGTICFYVSLDGKALVAWDAELWYEDYEKTKDFNFVILPKTDAGYTEADAAFNSSKLFKDYNYIVYALLDLIYGGKMTAGNHTLNIKAFSQQSVPMGTNYELSDDYFGKLPFIAENSVTFQVTQAGINNMVASSSARKLSHAGGEWATVDAHLLSRGSGVGDDATLLDVATQSEWKVVTNSYGEILYRTCVADVLYSCKYGTRIEERMLVKEDYMGGGTYGKPYFAEMVGFSFGPSLMNSMHYPVPPSKVK